MRDDSDPRPETVFPDGDRVLWAILRSGFAGGLIPAGGRPGRHDTLRLAWALKVTWALDAARAAEAAAGVVASRDIKAAAELLTQAECLRDTGRTEAAGALTSRDESIAAWDAHHGGSMSDPAVREKVYKAVAALRQKEIEQAEAAAVAQARAESKIPRRRRRM